MSRSRPAKHATKAPDESNKTTLEVPRVESAPVAAVLDRRCLDELEALRFELEQLEALAHVIDESQDYALDPPDWESRRRFLRLLNLLTNCCTRAYVFSGKAIDRVTGCAPRAVDNGDDE